MAIPLQVLLWCPAYLWLGRPCQRRRSIWRAQRCLPSRTRDGPARKLTGRKQPQCREASRGTGRSPSSKQGTGQRGRTRTREAGAQTSKGFCSPFCKPSGDQELRAQPGLWGRWPLPSAPPPHSAITGDSASTLSSGKPQGLMHWDVTRDFQDSRVSSFYSPT